MLLLSLGLIHKYTTRAGDAVASYPFVIVLLKEEGLQTSPKPLL